MARIAWTFFDPLTNETYSWEVNPNSGGSPSYRKKITFESSVAPDGKLLVMEGRDEPRRSQFSGVVLSQTQYNEMIDWFNKRHQMLLTDDLDRDMWIYIENFEPRRVWSRSHPWRHEYTVDYIILDWPS